MSRAYVTQAQVQQLRQRLSDRDTSVLVSVQLHRLMQAEQVRRLHFVDHHNVDSARRVCRRTLERLTKLGLLHRLDRRIGGVRAGSAGHVYGISSLGHRVLGANTRKRMHEPGGPFVHHTLAISELSTKLVEHARQAGHGYEVRPEPAAWRTWHDGFSKITLKPDLFVRLHDDDEELSWFVEIDCATESVPTLRRKMESYTNYFRAGIEQTAHGVFPLVLWVAPNQRRAQKIDEAIAASNLNVEHRIFRTTTIVMALSMLIDFEDESG